MKTKKSMNVSKKKFKQKISNRYTLPCSNNPLPAFFPVKLMNLGERMKINIFKKRKTFVFRGRQ